MVNKVVIGNAELYCGDCRDILPTLGTVDAVKRIEDAQRQKDLFI